MLQLQFVGHEREVFHALLLILVLDFLQAPRRFVLKQRRVLELYHARIHVAHATFGDGALSPRFRARKAIRANVVFLSEVVPVPSARPVSVGIFALQRLQDRVRLMLLAQELVGLEGFEVARFGELKKVARGRRVSATQEGHATMVAHLLGSSGRTQAVLVMRQVDPAWSRLSQRLGAV